MIVQRNTYKAKLGRPADLVAMIKGESDRLHMSYEVFTSLVGGPSGRVIVEWRFENEAAHEKFWDDWNALPGSPAFLERFYQLVENETTSELLTVR